MLVTLQQTPTIMKLKSLAAIAFVSLGTAAPAFADAYYQTTGPVVSVTDTTIVIQKDTEKREFFRTPDTKVTGTLKVGEKVTVRYKMIATSVEVKTDKSAPRPAKPANVSVIKE